MSERQLPIKWIQPLVAITIILGTIIFLQRDILLAGLHTDPIDFLPFIINIGPVSFMLYLRRKYQVAREFWLTPGTTIFWTITILLIIFLVVIATK